MKYRLKESCLNFHINSSGKEKTLKLVLLKKILDVTLRHSAFTSLRLGGEPCPRACECHCQKLVAPGLKRPEELLQAGRAESPSASWSLSRGLPKHLCAAQTTQRGCLQLSSRDSEHDKYSRHCRITKSHVPVSANQNIYRNMYVTESHTSPAKL